MHSKENLAFWLVPAAPDHELLAEIIRQLAERYLGPIFAPHLTLHGGEIEEGRALEALRSISFLPRYELDIESIDCSEKFTKTVFVRFRSTAELVELRTRLGDSLGLETSTGFDPHLSLLYKEMPLVEKAALTRLLTIPFDRVSFAGLALIAHRAEIRTSADVEAWRIIGERELLVRGT